MPESEEYLMESNEETFRLEVKTTSDEVRKQAIWCGIKPGLRVFDVGCGPGKTTAILYKMIQPGGGVVGIDRSEERIFHARKRYGAKDGIDFEVGDFRKDLSHLGKFDFIWVRFVLEYYRLESAVIIENLKRLLNPGGILCLLDLDYNCLSHYELPPLIGELLPKIMQRLEERYNFDAYAGRKLYSYLFDQGFEDIQVCLRAHHLIYGKLKDKDLFNWMKKIEVNAHRCVDLLAGYPGGYPGFISDFRDFFLHPRRFSYTPMLLCKGRLP